MNLDMEKSRITHKEDRNHKKDEKKPKKKGLERLYDKKPLIEFVVAVLSVPSLILVVILNYNSLKNLSASKAVLTPTPTSSVSTSQTADTVNTAQPNFFTAPITRTPRPTEQPSVSQAPCNKSLGPVNITSPNEGDTVNSNPVEIDISYDDGTYCSAVWAYSVNGSNWSNYDNNDVALYNLPNGQITFQLKVMSLTSSDTTTLTRHFTYTGQSTAATPTTASGSAQ